MAITATNFTPTPQRFSWTGLSEPEARGTLVPRAEIRFLESFSSVTAGGVGNEQTVSVTCTLPVNFAYVLAYASAALLAPASGENGNNFDDGSNWILQDAGTTGTSNQYAQFTSNAVSSHYADGKEVKIWQLDRMIIPNFVLKADPGNQPVFAGNFFNWTQNDGVYLFDFFARFLVYDINQAYHYEVNTPNLIR